MVLQAYLWTASGPKWARTQGLRLWGYSSLCCTPFASPGKELAIAFTPKTALALGLLPGLLSQCRGYGEGEFLSPWEETKNSSPQMPLRPGAGSWEETPFPFLALAPC